MSIRTLVAICFVATSLPATAQIAVVRNPGPDDPGIILRGALSGPHRIITSPVDADSAITLSRDSTYRTTVVILGHSARAEGLVHGDLIVVGGDLFVHPGARIEGRAIAIGGAVYKSMLSIVYEGESSYRSETFDVTRRPDGTYDLAYRRVAPHSSSPVGFPGAYGVRLPTYDRSDGVSAPIGPLISLGGGAIQVEPTVTYRSQLGAWDPAAVATFEPTDRAHIRAFAGRATFSNDSWIWSDAVNSLGALFLGLDTRNYYRADRYEVTAQQSFTAGSGWEIAPMLGLRTERDWSVRPDSFATGGPWSLFNRDEYTAVAVPLSCVGLSACIPRPAPDSSQHMLRGNPRVDDGTISSVLAGGRVNWASGGVRLDVNVFTEIAVRSPQYALSATSGNFVQTTLDGLASFPTFGTQSFFANAHWVETSGTAAPRQRWAYVGGSGTFPFIPFLSLGGDQLLFVEGDYAIPLDKINVPMVGRPTFTLRYVTGSAGIGALPSLEENVGLRLSLSFLRLDFLVDPNRRSSELGLGLSAAR